MGLKRLREWRLSAELWWQAVGDLWQRYAAVCRYAWQMRRKFEAPKRRSYETDFLPATLALQETPVSPAPRIAMWLLMVFLAIALLWSIFGKLDVVAVATGRIVPSDRTKVLQSFETATVSAIHVRDGQGVKAGDVLIELDATNASADIARIENDLLSARLLAARARAMLGAIDSGRDPVPGDLPGVPRDRLIHEGFLLSGLYGEYSARLARIDADIAKREAEKASTREVVAKFEKTVPIARRRADDFKNLVGKNFISQHGYLEKEQARIEQEADLAMQQGRLAELSASLREGRRQRVALVAETRRMMLGALDDAEQKAAAYVQELVKARLRGSLMTLTAPVDGTVQQLAVHTVGGVVTEAQHLLLVVPKDNPIEIEAMIENRDVGFVNAGQPAVVKIETFPFTKYGAIDGTVTSVSNDAINDAKRGLVFSARVQPLRSTLQVENKTVNLSPGMVVTVEIKTAQRRVIEYFLSPLLRHKDESLRER